MTKRLCSILLLLTFSMCACSVAQKFEENATVNTGNDSSAEDDSGTDTNNTHNNTSTENGSGNETNNTDNNASTEDGSGNDTSNTDNNTMIEDDSKEFDFPDLDTFETEDCYQSSAIDKYAYQAKAIGKEIDVYLKQQGTIDVGNPNTQDLNKTHVEIVLFDSCFGDVVNGTTFRLFANGEYYVSNQNGIDNIKLQITSPATNILEYRLIIYTINNLSNNTLIKCYSHDVDSDTPYNNDDFVTYRNNNISYHSSLMDKLSVGESICFYKKENYITPTQFASPVPSKFDYQMSAQKEGLYIYAYQITANLYSSLDDNTKWVDSSHIEIELFQHNVGYGFGGSYMAFWQDGGWYSNIIDHPELPQLKDMSFNVKTSNVDDGCLVEYYIFLKFNNNLDNPDDGPYAYVKFRNYDVDQGNHRYNDFDVVEYRDNRFVHTNVGNSIIVYQSIDGLDNPFETTYATNKLKLFNDNNKSRDNLTLFIGDSYFEPEEWWVRFYNDSVDGFLNKNAASSAIGGTKVSQWLNWNESLIKPFADENGRISNIVIHLGYNDIGSTQATDLEILNMMYELLDMLHSTYPDSNIYFVGIGRSEWFENTYRNINGVNVLMAETASNVDYGVYNYSLSRNWLTFVDTNNIYTRIKNQEGVNLAGIFKDGTHPKDNYYRYFIEAIANAGCQIDNI